MNHASRYELTAVVMESGAGPDVIPVRVEVVGNRPAALEVTWAGKTHRIEKPDYFGCLVELRELLEAEGRLLCCQGARGDAGPSGSLRQMSDGRQVYVYPEQRRRVSAADVVDAFAPADCSLVVTVEEQNRRHFARLGIERPDKQR
jgi:hypothetical protein